MTSTLTPLDRLLIAQFVYKYGESDSVWPEIASGFNAHPLRTAQLKETDIKRVYNELLESNNIERSTADTIPSPWAVALSKSLYLEYRKILLDQIKDDEAKFKLILEKIERLSKDKTGETLEDTDGDVEMSETTSEPAGELQNEAQGKTQDETQNKISEPASEHESSRESTAGADSDLEEALPSSEREQIDDDTEDTTVVTDKQSESGDRLATATPEPAAKRQRTEKERPEKTESKAAPRRGSRRKTAGAGDENDGSSPVSKRFQVNIPPLLSNISSLPAATYFMNPVSESQAPDYSSIVKYPTSLRNIKKDVKEGKITNIDEFEHAIWLMFANAIMFNPTESDMKEWTEVIMTETSDLFADFRSALN
ncbi:hypothetical protein CANCADRAFT_3266 [Tortispora caseinolytica NRRL Y-17796]|uniref:Bromo domain-containing protein n=1 Tax=Tortispora caseinolytica NRRL Y-17796 TaxID=767744 RepID=A0A1E4TA87_9ASCO|nr:hypothetical protein CANCADRAFT_3266 [Tortispora caseinolytica NRRL Y-17796]